MHTYRFAPKHTRQRANCACRNVARHPFTWAAGVFAMLLISGSAAASEVLRRGLGPEPDSLHIHRAQGLAAINLLRDLREGLTTYDAAGELVPGAAQSWEVLDDGRRYRFTLRENAAWSDGSSLVAEDFVRALRQAVNPADVAATAGLLAPIVNADEIIAGQAPPESLGVEATGTNTLEITLQQPTPWFPEILAHPVTYPLHASNEENPESVAQFEVNGAYRLAEWTPNALIRLEKNPHFHAADEVVATVVEYFPIEQPASELSRYRAGELHITETIPAGRFDWLRENLPNDLRIHPYLGSFWLNVNLRHPELGRSADLRRALALAINREILTRVVIGAGEQPAWSVVPPGIDGYQPAMMPEAELSQEKREALAKELFARSGAADSGPLRLQLRYNTSGVHRRTAVAVAAMWKQVLGVDTELFNEEWKVFVNNRRLGVVTEVFRGGWIADYADPGTFLDLFRSDSEMNFTFLANARFDELMRASDRARGKERQALLAQAESVLLEEMPAIPLYYYVSRHLVNPGVRGYVDNVRDIHLSRYLSLEQP